jgi:hypothetical protein
MSFVMYVILQIAVGLLLIPLCIYAERVGAD